MASSTMELPTIDENKDYEKVENLVQTFEMEGFRRSCFVRRGFSAKMQWPCRAYTASRLRTPPSMSRCFTTHATGYAEDTG